ncbi:DUF1080 domain-containing protein [Verrucomicrobiaceae bacterium 5K15]|uniref:DUF1080 domain-containing protein n=1 Tax=Oceaniferula flava TaxID=2800421 RepID=A0AAE2VE76_9BACT|nr:DUF1080 domain-containing protein [Oceaniferula flavus]MBK1855479.1 DUF1080 domain-containing protein [Oceaniferula flavus]MBM1136785.1 DUF1080 domain-containing protein [Oceaniferula flavus]
MKLITLLTCAICLGTVHAQEPAKPVPLFNGKDLSGWKTVNPAFMEKWSVEDGSIVAGNLTDKIPRNTYLATEKQYEDFEFRCLFRIRGDHATGLINSGIQYRSIIKGKKIIGYQADIGKDWWGGIYDEHRRKKLVKGDTSTLERVLNPEGWNSYIIRCIGNHHELYINGVKTADYVEKNPKIPSKGHIAVQIHSGGKAKVEFRDLTITEFSK